MKKPYKDNCKNCKEGLPFPHRFTGYPNPGYFMMGFTHSICSGCGTDHIEELGKKCYVCNLREAKAAQAKRDEDKLLIELTIAALSNSNVNKLGGAVEVAEANLLLLKKKCDSLEMN